MEPSGSSTARRPLVPPLPRNSSPRSPAKTRTSSGPASAPSALASSVERVAVALQARNRVFEAAGAIAREPELAVAADELVHLRCQLGSAVIFSQAASGIGDADL